MTQEEFNVLMDAWIAENGGSYTSAYTGAQIDSAIAAVPGKAPLATDTTATLSTTWSGSGPYTQSVSISGMTSSKKIEVGLASTASATQRAAAREAQLMCTAQSSGSITITADGTKPTVSLPIIVRVVS